MIIFVLAHLLATVCGQNVDDWKLVGGSLAGDGEYPYQVSLKIGQRHICGGSIINSATVLTAAHCVYRIPAQQITVTAGSNHLNEDYKTFEVERYIIHTEFEGTKNDIALIKLTNSVKYSKKIRPIFLENKYVHGGVECVLSGWGMLSYPSNKPSNDLQHIVLKTIVNQECVAKHNFSSPPVYDSNLCTLTQKGEGACKGDSGGPLVANGKQIGIVSWGRPCAKGIPDVFTRVSSYIDWINANAFQ
ncbi:hypothetical protein RN001_014827 [Aquatica leii]|uniref:Peptidase S1 domain-containing protein n=1 Tax=Aquatica leii TaxID=1421715 RepID=A0AAN7P118_9COLE|nr:hypothetical protein RN001_014827 [Aquatica leii]